MIMYQLLCKAVYEVSAISIARRISHTEEDTPKIRDAVETKTAHTIDT